MTPLLLPGLIGTQPLGALAAFGLLRVCSLTQVGQVKLGWDLSATPTAVLWFEQPTQGDDLIGRVILPWLAGRWVCRVFGVGVPGRKEVNSDAEVFGVEAEGEAASKSDRNRDKAMLWDNDIKVSRETFASELRQARTAADRTSRHNADYLIAYATDAREVKSSSRGLLVATTSLCMTAGNQAFLKLLRELAYSLDAGGEWSRPLNEKKTKFARILPSEAFRQALLAEWDFSPKNARDQGFLPLGWDAESYYVAALRGHATPDFTPPRAAIWLAAEALPLFPCTAITRGRVQTRGYDMKGDVFRWPIWRKPLSLRAVQTALGHPALYEKQITPAVIHALGLDQVYGSGIIALTDYASFRPPTLLADVLGEMAKRHVSSSDPSGSCYAEPISAIPDVR